MGVRMVLANTYGEMEHLMKGNGKIMKSVVVDIISGMMVENI